MRIAALFLSLVFALAGPVLAQGPDSTSVQQKDRGKVTIGAGTTSATTTGRSEEHTSELQSLMRISYAVFCLKKKTKQEAGMRGVLTGTQDAALHRVRGS